MVGSTVAVLSGGDPARWAAIAGLTALAVAIICFIAYIFKLSSVVNFISDSILLGFKAGAALSIMATQLPKIFGVEGGGSNFFTRIWTLMKHLPDTIRRFDFWPVAMAVLISGDISFQRHARSAFGCRCSHPRHVFHHLATAGVHITGNHSRRASVHE